MNPKTRIAFIADLINDAQNVVDVGSDHAYLAKILLVNNKAQHVTNIEVNQGPLENGINNLTKNNLLKRTTNILNDGFKGLILEQTFDYCVIAGMGATSIIEILKQNKNQIKNYILQPNTQSYKIRKYLNNHSYQIKVEHIFVEKKIFYEIIICSKTINVPKLIEKDYYISSQMHKDSLNLYFKFLKRRYEYLKALDISLVSENIVKEYEYIKEFINEKNGY
ncbi:tRNA (adenine(22)-N(1))-methyltransferase TrmK [Ureaplasma parvum]|uniref:tRNA (adenine(22)-N(1))-methyltransferase TrmK n=2 Tax=Ureaplasma parvum TaxID=134821 RepID=UPI000B4CA204|nr:tRNA (adenine(22)-N(1))-methyltransferase TrmK [Ureaplasma parvum]ASD25380.1 tRNA (adenine-N(1))-methyltransferase [Ureaplasma parvum]